MDQANLELALKAQNLQIQGFYDQAIYLYSEILKQVEDYNILIARAQAFAITNNLQKAISDCESAIFNEHNKFEGYYFRGQYNFKMGKFKPAIIDFKEALQKLDKNHVQADSLACQIQIWINKVNAELNNIDFKQFTKDVNIEQLQKEAAILKLMEEKAEQQKIDMEKKNSGQKEFIWHQTDDKIFIEVSQALDSEEDLKVTIEDKKLDIYFPIDKVKNIFFDLKIGLFDEVVAKESVTKTWLDKIEVILKKKNASLSWDKLEDNESKSIVHLAKQIYPSSSKKKKDWSKIDQELEKEVKDDKPGDPFNNFMSTLYQNSSEEVKRAMIKSLQTSGGTVLSTNWDEVKNKDYEGKDRPDAPKGQEWAKVDKWK